MRQCAKNMTLCAKTAWRLYTFSEYTTCSHRSRTRPSRMQCTTRPSVVTCDDAQHANAPCYAVCSRTHAQSDSPARADRAGACYSGRRRRAADGCRASAVLVFAFGDRRQAQRRSARRAADLRIDGVKGDCVLRDRQQVFLRVAARCESFRVACEEADERIARRHECKPNKSGYRRIVGDPSGRPRLD